MNKEKINLREKLLENGFENVILLKNFDYEDALIGVTCDNRAVYDYDLMVKSLMDSEEWTEEEAIEWVEYNTLRALPYMGSGSPIVMYSLG